MTTTTRDSVDVAGTRRTFTTVASTADSASRALVLVFHGSRQSGDKHRAFTSQAYDRFAAAGTAVVAYLDGYQGAWNDARRESRFAARRDGMDDVGFARAVITKLAADHRIDSRRVFAIGYSNGGQLVMRLVHEAPELLAGAAVIGATMPAPENFLATEAPPAPLPMLFIHGTKDPIVSYGGGTMGWWKRRFFKVGGRSWSAPRTARHFAERNGSTAGPVITREPARPGAVTEVERSDYREDGAPPVVLYTIHRGGHTVPGSAGNPRVLGRTSREVEAAGLIGTFFGLLVGSGADSSPVGPQ
ncbi:alpha/beta hydrolase family esterase [Amycolatopsis jiangsuensis]|uniref:Polyhydroxybutyrate depolymerase n=1 Tax=Amycolatopsis jiangsuensis TaxID=1181879 RepID=A0A840J1K4_9PSEU|nr:PHB depolymerase family esterase [Amycolatopsis jiangsuensis]MBB4688886.1 polyhydroxybutyrate depolymerase [Amycolatopsis jiangsuensis]